MTGQTQGAKCVLACNYCRVKKAKCSGTKPCTYCLDHNEECWYPAPPPRTRKRKGRNEALDERFARLEALIRTSRSPNQDRNALQISPRLPSASSHADDTAPLSTSESPATGQHAQSKRRCTSSPETAPGDLLLSIPAACFTGSSDVTQGAFLQEHRHSDSGNPTPASSMPSDESYNARQAPVSLPTTISPEACTGSGIRDVGEIEGPASYLSICSEPAVDWVSDYIGVPDFAAMARRLTIEVMGNDKQRTAHPQRAPEPDFTTAWLWTTAYFEGGWDATFEIIDRPAFEQRLRAQFESQEFDIGQDPAWYALRNTVYAAGYRNMVSDGAYPSAFIKARTQAWRYFENSLSVHTELIYGRSGIASIQALAAMAFFAEGLGSPSMEYMLLTNAIHLAQSQGLHLQAKKSWKLRPEEVSTRNALWWRLYTYDKLLASRSGRPSVIDDDDISCPSPTVGIGGSDTKGYLSRIVVKNAQISSLILKRLWSVKAMRQTLEEVLAVVQDLDQQLREWHSSLAPIYRNSPPYRPTNLPPGVHHYNIVFICFIYNSCLIAMHSLFSYPWGRPGSGASQDPRILAQKQRSSDIVASAAREIIMAVQDVRISASSPVWLTFYFPLLGLINLFLHVIQNPRLPTADSDIALMDAIAGHFSYLEYASASQLGTHFPQKMVPYAREAVKRAWRAPTPQCAQQPTTIMAELLGPGLTELYTDFPLSECVTSELPEFTYDNWPTFISDLAETLL